MKYFLVLLSFLITISLFSQTTVPTTISENSVWTKSGSPYLITKNLRIEANVKVTVEPGVEIEIAPSVSINIYGSFKAIGITGDSVIFKCSQAGKSWNIINFYGDTLDFSFCSIRSAYRFINVTKGNINISNSYIQSTALAGNGNDCIAVHDAKKVVINRIVLQGAGGTIAGGSKNDAIDLDNIDSAFISYSQIFSFSDDAIDIGTQTKYANISHNKIWKTNFGISIGEDSKALVYRNISIHNDAGMQVHNNASVVAWNNLFYDNTDGIECYHSEEGENVESGGTLVLKNSIFYKNTRSNIRSQSSSKITINNCISDLDSLAGKNNLKADALIQNPATGNFNLSATSPCIDAGEPDTLESFSGITTDMGPFEYSGQNKINGINKEISFQLFPNPAKERIHYIFSNQLQEPSVLKIYDMQGRKMLELKIVGKVGSIPLNNFGKGNYTINVETKNSKVSQNFQVF